MQKYEQIRQIGRGSFGTVYKCRVRGTGQFVALKLIDIYGRSSSELSQLKSEVRMLSEMKHVGIVRFYESFEMEGVLGLATELGEADLFSLLKAGPLSELMIQQIAYMVLCALEFLHRNRIAHRDIKGSNVLLTSDGLCKLCDFGFARQLSAQTLQLNSIKGSPIYLAPEIARGESYSYPADVWSFGVMLFELACGQPPLMARDYIQLLRLLQQDSLEIPYQKHPVFVQNDALRDFLQCCLRLNPDKRQTPARLLEHPFVNPEGSLKFSAMKQRLFTFQYRNWPLDAYAEHQITETAHNRPSEPEDLETPTDAQEQRIHILQENQGSPQWELVQSEHQGVQILVKLLRGVDPDLSALRQSAQKSGVSTEEFDCAMEQTADAFQQRLDVATRACLQQNAFDTILESLEVCAAQTAQQSPLTLQNQQELAHIALLLRLVGCFVGCGVSRNPPAAFGNGLTFPFEMFIFSTSSRRQCQLQFFARSEPGVVERLVSAMVCLMSATRQQVQEASLKLLQIYITLEILAICAQLSLHTDAPSYSGLRWEVSRSASKSQADGAAPMGQQLSVQLALLDALPEFSGGTYLLLQNLLELNPQPSISNESDVQNPVSALINEGFQLYLQEVITTLFGSRTGEPPNIPQFIYNQQQKLFGQYTAARGSRSAFVRQIQLGFLEVVRNIQDLDSVILQGNGKPVLFDTEKPNKLFAHSSKTEIVALSDALRAQTPAEFMALCVDNSCELGAFCARMRRFYAAVVATMPYCRLESLDQTEQQLVTLSGAVLTRFFFQDSYQQNAVDEIVEKTELCLDAPPASQQSFQGFVQALRQTERSRDVLILPHAELVRAVMAEPFKAPQQMYLFGLVGSFGKLAFQALYARKGAVVDDKLVVQWASRPKGQQPVTKSPARPDSVRLQSQKILVALAKNNVQISQLIERQNFQVLNEHVSFSGLLALQLLAYECSAEENDVSMALLSLLIQNDREYVNQAEKDCIAITKLVPPPGRAAIEPLFLPRLLVQKMHQDLAGQTKATYKFNSNWVIGSLPAETVQTITGTFIQLPPKQAQSQVANPNFLQVVGLFYALLKTGALQQIEHGIADVISAHADEVLQTAVQGSVSDKRLQLYTQRATGAKLGLMDRLLQLLHSVGQINVQLMNRLTAVCLSQFVQRRSQQRCACFRAKHKDLMQLECASEGCLECLRSLNGLDSQAEEMQQGVGFLLSYQGYAAYVQIVDKLRREERFGSMILQEVVCLLVKALDPAFLELQYTLYGQDLVEQTVLMILRFLYELGQTTANLSLYVAAAVDFQLVRRILGAVKYLRNSMSHSLCLALISYLQNIESPTAAVFSHQFVMAGGLSAAFVNWIDSPAFRHARVSGIHFAISSWATCCQRSQIYTQQLQILEETHIEHFLARETAINLHAVFWLCASLVYFDGSQLEKIQIAVGAALLYLKKNPKGPAASEAVELLRAALLHSRAYLEGIKEIWDVLALVLCVQNADLNLKKKIMELAFQMVVLGEKPEFGRALIEICAQKAPDELKGPIRKLRAAGAVTDVDWTAIWKKVE